MSEFVSGSAGLGYGVRGHGESSYLCHFVLGLPGGEGGGVTLRGQVHLHELLHRQVAGGRGLKLCQPADQSQPRYKTLVVMAKIK